MATILLGSLILFMMVGVPVAFAVGGASLLGFLLQRGWSEIPYNIIAQRTLYGLNSFTFLAVPFFLLTGQLMNTGGVTQRIFSFANCLVGHVRGGLAHVNVLGSMIFAGMSGSSVADAAGLGAIEIKAPAMTET
jgi:TRAP-type mannitol/chloroaromatic compound transport system permease large subunit